MKNRDPKEVKSVKKIGIRKFKTSDLASIKKFIKSLHPEWFTEEALENIPRDIQVEKCFVAEEKEKAIGFVSFHSYEGKPMIGWLGIKKTKRGMGIGKMLVDRVEKTLRKLDYKELRVETVGECNPVYPPYAETLRFYMAMGFKVEKRGRLRHDMGYQWRHSTLKKKI